MSVLRHSSTINDIVVCTKSNSCVTCSNDGRVIITNVSNYTVTAKLVLNRPIISISLDPFFPRSGRLITGSDKIEIHKRKFTGSYAGDVISVNDGIVSNILWRNNIIIYCSDISVRMYDLSSNVYFGVIHKPVIEVNNKSITFSIMWGTNDNLIVAIGMSIKVMIYYVKLNYFG
ncbi:hypothetical protein A3Q56_08181 [Intoshia linei]|uniref:Vps41 beta-propeller domain-containing protein n=1 Tax=Intoshia linei TaxID=1819745 RepID=A0A177AQ28_9BILA|nr:hypothetical protein A3Q56_08181 [Intoshia linei]